jgi:hypothetical protein
MRQQLTPYPHLTTPSPATPTHQPTNRPRLRRTTGAPTTNTDRTDGTPTTTIQALHRQHAFQRLGLHFSKKKNWKKISAQHVSSKFLKGFCCLKCIEGFYCAFGWLLVDSEVVKKNPLCCFLSPAVLLSISFEFVDL